MTDLELTKKGEAFAAANYSQPEELPPPLIVDCHSRRSIADSIEKLIDMLDAMSPDPDLEDGPDDEPWLGWTERGPTATSNMFLDGRGSAYDDREADDSDYEDDGTAEPSLGAPERHPVSRDADTLSGLQMPRSGFLYVVGEKSQEHWVDGAPGDHEREAEDEHGGDINDEPQDGNELEADDGDYDSPGFIWGGNEDGR